ncbi:MAG TPA: hypothetical protein VFX49_17715, partial [Chloroflexota bacterium]|nr:hypothetical protein [Chloroflexota bacterium]
METVGGKLTSDPRVTRSIGTAGRILSTALHAVAAGATWSARVLDEWRLQPPGRRGGPPRGTPGGRGEVVHYVTGEICCVVAADGLTAANARSFYDSLRESLNASAGALVKDWLADPLRDRRKSSFDLDMAPTVLGRLAGDARVHQYVGSLERVTERDKEEPFVILEGPDGQPASLLAFCSAARADLSPDERRECVRELVNLMNADVERV